MRWKDEIAVPYVGECPHGTTFAPLGEECIVCIDCHAFQPDGLEGWYVDG